MSASMGDMTRSQLFSRIGKLRTRNQRRLNDIHIWSSLALVALKRAEDDSTILRQQEFFVPSSRPDKIVIRKPKRVRKILSGAAADLRTAVLVYATAQVEAFLNDIISAVLRFDPRR